MFCQRHKIERAMAEIFTSVTQPFSHSGRVAATQPLSHSEWLSGWVAAPATLAEWLSGWVAGWQSGWVAEWLLQPLSSGWVAAPATLAEWLSGWVAAPQPLWQSGWVAEWLLQPLWQSGWVAECLSGCSSHSGRVAEWLRQPLWQSGWVAEWLRQSHQSMKWTDKVLKCFKHFNIQARVYIYDIDSNLIYKHNPVNFNCHSYITSTDWLRTATYTLWTITWNHLKRKSVVMNSTSSGLETTITTTIWWAKNGYGVL